MDDWDGDVTERKGVEMESISETVGGVVCTYLGWYVDAETHHAFPSVANHCHTQEPPLTIEVDYQASTCLEGDWAACPRYKGALSQGTIQRSTALPWLRRTMDRRLPSWAIASLALAVVVLTAGLFLVLRPVVSAPSSATPTSAASIVGTAPTSTTGLGATQVSSPTPSPTPSPSPTATEQVPTQLPSPTSSATPLPSPTATAQVLPTLPGASLTVSVTAEPAETTSSSPTRTPMATLTWTPTARPTWTPTSVPTQAPISTPRPTPGPTRPAPTATQGPVEVGVQYPAPALISPADGQVFSERDVITLRWQPVGQLAPNEYYVSTVAYLRFGDTWYDDTPWTKDTQWTLSDHRYLLDLSDDSEFRCAVRVMRRTGINSEGKPEGVAVSPMSDVRSFTWTAPSGGVRATPDQPPP